MVEPNSVPESILIEPSEELTFTGPFTESTSSSIVVTNGSKKEIVFKVKTTAPKQYCVRPNSGIVAPGDSKEIKVILQPMPDYDPTERIKHKFMVQTMYAPEGENFDADAIWKTAVKGQMTDQKIKCCFRLPEEDENELRNRFEGASEPLSEPFMGSAMESDPQTSAVENARRILAELEPQHVAESGQLRGSDGYHSSGVLDCLAKLLQDHNAVMVIIFVFILGFITGVVFI